MRVYVILGLSVMAWAQPRPSPDEQSRTLAAAGSSSLNYAKKLPDFICTETIRQLKSVLSSTTTGDTLTIQLTYSGKGEQYALQAINGRKTDQTYESLHSLISGGEFGTTLQRIFDPASATDFQWKGWTTVSKQKTAAYSFRVARDHSHYIVGYHTPDGQLQTSVVGEQGVIDIDVDTSRVLRITAGATEIPKDFPVLRASSLIEYGWTEVAGARHLLPLQAEVELAYAVETIKNLIAFTDYRKFAADSTIDFK